MIPELAIAMLACARIGATHIGHLRRLQRRGRRRSQQRRQGASSSSPPTAAGGAARSCRSRTTSTPPWPSRRPSRSASSSTAATSTIDDEGRPRPLVARADGRRPRPTAPPSRSTASTRSSSSTRRGSTGKPKGILHTTGGLPARHCPDASTGSSTSRRTTPTGAPPTSAGSPGTATSSTARSPTARRRVMYEGAPNHPTRTASGRSSRSTASPSSTPPRPPSAPSSSGATQWPEEARPVEPAPAGHGRRADQSRGVDVVSRGDRRRPLPDRRYLVADRDRRDHDRARCPARSPTKPGSATRPLPGVDRRDRRQAGQAGAGATRAGCSSSSSPGRRCCGPSTATTSATGSSTGAQVPGVLLHRRRRPPRRGRLLLDHGPRRRRAERLRPPARARWRSRAPWCIIRKVAEAAVVGKPDEIKGEGIACFVTLEVGRRRRRDELKKELQAHVVKEIGALARPDEIRFTDSLPKTRSGKIMRRLLRDIAGGKHTTQDTTTLEDFSVLALARGRGGVSLSTRPHSPAMRKRGLLRHSLARCAGIPLPLRISTVTILPFRIASIRCVQDDSHTSSQR